MRGTHAPRCPMGGAPKGKANGAYRHGLYPAKAADERRRLRDLLAHVRETMAGIS